AIRGLQDRVARQYVEAFLEGLDRGGDHTTRFQLADVELGVHGSRRVLIGDGPPGEVRRRGSRRRGQIGRLGGVADHMARHQKLTTDCTAAMTLSTVGITSSSRASAKGRGTFAEATRLMGASSRLNPSSATTETSVAPQPPWCGFSSTVTSRDVFPT